MLPVCTVKLGYNETRFKENSAIRRRLCGSWPTLSFASLLYWAWLVLNRQYDKCLPNTLPPTIPVQACVIEGSWWQCWRMIELQCRWILISATQVIKVYPHSVPSVVPLKLLWQILAVTELFYQLWTPPPSIPPSHTHTHTHTHTP